MAAVEGQVIGVHSDAAWKEHIEKGKESKKLVIILKLDLSFCVFILILLGR
jgi:hypothetical protein